MISKPSRHATDECDDQERWRLREVKLIEHGCIERKSIAVASTSVQLADLRYAAVRYGRSGGVDDISLSWVRKACTYHHTLYRL